MGIVAECSSKINTRNLFKKIGLALIVLGCLIDISGNHNSFVEVGAMSYIVADLWRKYKEK